MTIFEYKQHIIKTLSSSTNKSVTLSPSLDAEILLCHFLDLTKTKLLLDSRKEIEQDKIDILNKALEKRLTGLPIAYITNSKEFYGYNFYVDESVLIPKPDTEILVEEAVNIILEKMDAHPNTLLTICDMCTGSGCIALAVLKTLIDTYNIPFGKLPKFTLVDISEKALNVAKKNADSLLSSEQRKLVRFNLSNLFESIPYSFDIILTNPPYIPHSLVDDLLLDGRSEPRLALDGDIDINGDAAIDSDNNKKDDGLEVIENLIPQAKEHLNPMGCILMEAGEYNIEKASMIGNQIGFKSEIYKDLEGQLRVVKFN